MSETSLLQPEEWLCARRTRTNVLLNGIHSIEEIERWLRVNLDEPVTIWHPGDRLRLPPVAKHGTLVVHHVETLTQEDQELLLDWTAATAGRTWVISTTRATLWPLVESGAFRDALYYRLNIVCTTIAVPPG